MSALQIGLVGCGTQGRVLSAALQRTGKAEFVACADVDESASRRAVQDYGYRSFYRDYQDMLRREKLDAVMVAVPHHLLRDAAIGAISTGCHVFLEKPMAMNRREGEEICDAALTKGVSVMVGYCLRFAEGRRMAKELIDRGAIGDIVLVNAGKGSRPLEMMLPWPGDPELGGGQLHFLGVHVTDQVLWMVGAAPQRVHAEVHWHPETGADQNSAYTIRFSNDVIANVIVSQNIGRRMESSFDFIEVLGTAGHLRAEWPTNTLYVYSERLPEYKHPTVIRPRRILNDEMYQNQMDAWIGSVTERRPPPITTDDGVKVLTIIDAVFESARTGKPVTLR